MYMYGWWFADGQHWTLTSILGAPHRWLFTANNINTVHVSAAPPRSPSHDQSNLNVIHTNTFGWVLHRRIIPRIEDELWSQRVPATDWWSSMKDRALNTLCIIYQSTQLKIFCANERTYVLVVGRQPGKLYIGIHEIAYQYWPAL